MKIDTSKKLIWTHVTVSVLLCVATIVTNYLGFDVTALAALAGTSLAITGAWGGFYFWKAKNENRAKYAQRFLKQFADKYGADVAVRVAEIELKD